MRGISSLIDTDMEDSTNFVDENMIITSDPEAELPKKNGAQSKAADNGITKTKSAPQKPKVAKEDGVKKAARKATATKRKAMDEQVSTENQAAKKRFTTAAVQSGDELDGENPKQVAKAKPKRKPKKAAVDNGADSDHSAAVIPQSQQDGDKKPKISQKAINNAPQPELVEPDSNTEAIMRYSPAQPVKKAVQATSRTWPENASRRRAGSASDTERAGDPNLRRKLGDVTRKFENIDLKYRNLKEVGIVEANANMEKLRRQCEVTTSASTELIESLKNELAMQMPLAQEAKQLQVDLRNSKTETAEYRETVSNLESSLTAAQNEIKALQAKLAASRSSATSVESANAKTPGSAIKNSSQVRTVMVGSAEAAQAAQTAQLKEDLYSDLTGLIIRNVKRTEEGDAYDCIQTGRNGSEFSQFCISDIH